MAYRIAAATATATATDTTTIVAVAAAAYWAYYYYYYYYYYKCQDYSAAITQFIKSSSKTVAQLNADVCWPSE